MLALPRPAPRARREIKGTAQGTGWHKTGPFAHHHGTTGCVCLPFGLCNATVNADKAHCTAPPPAQQHRILLLPGRPEPAFGPAGRPISCLSCAGRA